jgi:hypothetical protein
MIAVKSMELVDTVPMQCITVDCPTESYILKNGMVTHNSTLITYLFMYMALKGYVPGFGKVNFGLYVSDSMRNNVKTSMEKIAAVYYESKYLQSQFESVHLTQEEASFVRHPTTKAELAAYKQTVEVEKKDKKMLIKVKDIDSLPCEV